MFNLTAAESSPVLCRFCAFEIGHPFLDLGMSPLCETQIHTEQLNHAEVFFPLRVYVCPSCKLVQLDEYVAPADIFSDEYPYFSSVSASWVEHARRYCDEMCERFGLDESSLVFEVASNDGYLLQHFVERNVPVLGIEPAGNVAKVARAKGVATESCFFGSAEAERLVQEFGKPQLLLGNNVLAHVPDIVDFVKGMKIALADCGIITMEFPHLLNLIDQNQFDTIYHEHFSYLSLSVVQNILAAEGLTLFDVHELQTHGGSLRIFARHDSDKSISIQTSIAELLQREKDFGLQRLETYDDFANRVKETKRGILEFLIKQKGRGLSVAGYGAPGKGNTLLNYCGIRTDFLDFTVDRSPSRFGTYTPGTRIPILEPDAIRTAKPDFLFILPWNLAIEIMKQTEYIREWGGRWVTPIPEIRVFT